MPPWLDSAEEVGAVLVAVLTALGAVTVGMIGLAAVVITAWRSKVKPLLTGTQEAAEVAAHELRNNSGTSTRDAVDRMEKHLEVITRDVRYLRGDVANWQNHNNAVHRDHGDRLRSLETPHERTLP